MQEIGEVAENAIEYRRPRCTGMLDGAAKLSGKVLEALADMISPTPPPTKEQAERMERTAEEQAQRNAQAIEEAARKEFIDQLARDGRRREEEDLARRLADQLRRDRGTRGRETDHSRGRERERER